MSSICIFGASSTWGAWDKEMGGWINRLRLFIDNNNFDDGLVYFVYNLVSLEKFENNLMELIDKAQKTTSKILFLGLKPIDEKKTNPVLWDNDVFYKTANIEKYDKKLMEVVNKNKAEYIRMYDVLGKNDLSDGLHLNESGHEKTFLEIKKFLIENKWI